MKKLILQHFLALSILLLSLAASADTFDNAVKFFDFAEDTYPTLLTPKRPSVQEIQGYYVRHYSDSGIYIGLLGDQVYALGGYLGNSLTYVGAVKDFVLISMTDISDVTLTNERVTCSYYVENLFAQALDIQRDIGFESAVEISIADNKCKIVANSIPNHSFNDETASFADNVAEIIATYELPLYPEFADAVTRLTLEIDNAVFLNGVKLDLLAAGCFGVGDGKIGCSDVDTAWRYDPMSPLTSFGVDEHNAHVQPVGQYHYHGNPNALFDQNGASASPVIGFAADGFPIYGSFINDQGALREVQSSYQLKAGARPPATDSPGGSYDGEFIDDWEYREASGDLDECNGMMRNGSYGYYVVNQYPWVLACYKGTPDPSFSKSSGTSSSSPGPGTGKPPPPPKS